MRAEDAMTQEEADFANDVASIVGAAMFSMMRNSPRSEWSHANKIGVSDIGHCREYLRRTIIDEPFSDEQTDYHAAFIGTAVGDLAEKAIRQHLFPADVRTQTYVNVSLDVLGFRLNIPGHPDVILGDAVWDFKTKDGLGVVRRAGPEERHRWQVILYTKAAIDAGEIDADKAWCVLIYLDRSGRDLEPVVYAWRYDPAEIAVIEQWLEDVIYAVQNDEETVRDMPRSWCWEACPRVTACRGRDTDVEGLITDDVVKDAIRVLNDAREAKKLAEKDIKSAQSALTGVAGTTDDGHTVRWIEVGPAELQGYTRSGYKRLDVRNVTKGRGRKAKP